MAREFLMFCREVSYGTADLTTGAPTTGAFGYIRLAEGNAFAMRQNPVQTKIPWGGGLNIPGLTVADSHECTGRLRTQLYYSQASMLLNWAVSRINSGRTTPWTTTDAGAVMPPGDLASVSIYHAKLRSDGTYKRTRYSGCKVASWTLSLSRQSPIAMLELDLRAQKAFGNAADSSSDPNATEFPAPDDADYPSDLVLFSHSAGGLTIETLRTLYESIDLRSTNRIAPNWYESKFLQSLQFFGRETTLAAKGQLKATPDDRAALEALTEQEVELVLSDGSTDIELSLFGQNHFETIEDDLSLDDEYKYTMNLMNYYDSAEGGDQPDLAVAVGATP